MIQQVLIVADLQVTKVILTFGSKTSTHHYGWLIQFVFLHAQLQATHKLTVKLVLTQW